MCSYLAAADDNDAEAEGGLGRLDAALLLVSEEAVAAGAAIVNDATQPPPAPPRRAPLSLRRCSATGTRPGVPRPTPAAEARDVEATDPERTE